MIGFARKWLSNQAAEMSAHEHFPITQGDDESANFPALSRAIYVGVAGDIAIVTESDTVCVYKSVPAGSRIDIRAKRVNATGSAVRVAGDSVGQY